MSISVIIPVKNEEDYLNELFQVLARDPREFPIIFCDGGSTDQSFDMIKNFQTNNQDRRVEICSKTNCMQSILSTFLACHQEIKTEFVFLHPVDIDCSSYIQKIAERGEYDYFIFKKCYRPEHWFLKLQASCLNYTSQKSLSFVWTNGLLLKTSIYRSLTHLQDFFLEDVILSDYLKRNFKGCCKPYFTICSSRRYLRQGIFRRTVINFIIMFCYRVVGVNTKTLRKIYYRS